MGLIINSIFAVVIAAIFAAGVWFFVNGTIRHPKKKTTTAKT
jgi:hypothetical protein